MYVYHLCAQTANFIAKLLYLEIFVMHDDALNIYHSFLIISGDISSGQDHNSVCQPLKLITEAT